MLNDVGSFDEILAEAAAVTAPTVVALVDAAGEGAATEGGAGEGTPPHNAVAAAEQTQQPAEAPAELEILSSDEEGGEGGAEERIIELPSTAKKRRFASFPSQVCSGR